MKRRIGIFSRRARAALLFVLGLVPARHAMAQCDGAVRKMIAVAAWTEARAVVQSALVSAPESDSLSQCMGEIAFYAIDTDDAVRWFERAIAANEGSALHHAWLGKSLAQGISSVNKLRLPFVAKRMRGEFERAIALDPSLIDAREGLMNYYLQAPTLFGGSMDRAREQAMEIGRLNAMRGHIDLAVVLFKGKDSAGAERELRAATQVALPDSSAAILALASFYVSERRWSDAFDVCDRGVTAYPSATVLHLRYGQAAALSGQNLERGEREIKLWMTETSQGAAPSIRAGAHVRLGMIYGLQGRPALARSEFEAALAILPDYAEAKRALQALNRGS